MISLTQTFFTLGIFFCSLPSYASSYSVRLIKPLTALNRVNFLNRTPPLSYPLHFGAINFHSHPSRPYPIHSSSHQETDLNRPSTGPSPVAENLRSFSSQGSSPSEHLDLKLIPQNPSDLLGDLSSLLENHLLNPQGFAQFELDAEDERVLIWIRDELKRIETSKEMDEQLLAPHPSESTVESDLRRDEIRQRSRLWLVSLEHSLRVRTQLTPILIRHGVRQTLRQRFQFQQSQGLFLTELIQSQFSYQFKRSQEVRQLVELLLQFWGQQEGIEELEDEIIERIKSSLRFQSQVIVADQELEMMIVQSKIYSRAIRTLTHTIKGNYEGPSRAGFLLKNGLHTREGLNHWIALNQQVGKNYTLERVSRISQGSARSGIILEEVAEQGIIKLQFPAQALTSSQLKRTFLFPGDPHSYQGIKTLWPEHFSARKIAEAIESVLLQNHDSKDQILEGFYEGIRAVLVRDSTGRVITFYPHWIQ